MRYSNGTGHLIISIVVIITMAMLMFFKVIDISTGMAPLGIVIAFWFLSGTANRFGASGTPPNPVAGEHFTIAQNKKIEDATSPIPDPVPAPPQSKITNAVVPQRPPAAG